MTAYSSEPSTYVCENFPCCNSCSLPLFVIDSVRRRNASSIGPVNFRYAGWAEKENQLGYLTLEEVIVRKKTGYSINNYLRPFRRPPCNIKRILIILQIKIKRNTNVSNHSSFSNLIQLNIWTQCLNRSLENEEWLANFIQTIITSMCSLVSD